MWTWRGALPLILNSRAEFSKNSYHMQNAAPDFRPSVWALMATACLLSPPGHGSPGVTLAMACVPGIRLLPQADSVVFFTQIPKPPLSRSMNRAVILQRCASYVFVLNTLKSIHSLNVKCSPISHSASAAGPTWGHGSLLLHLAPRLAPQNWTPGSVSRHSQECRPGTRP